MHTCMCYMSTNLRLITTHHAASVSKVTNKYKQDFMPCNCFLSIYTE